MVMADVVAVRSIGRRWHVFAVIGAILWLGVGLGVTPAHAGFLYALNNAHAGNTIYGFAVNEATGTLTPLAGSPVPSGGIGSLGSAISETATIHFDSATHASTSSTIYRPRYPPLSERLRRMTLALQPDSPAVHRFLAVPCDSPERLADCRGDSGVTSFNIWT
jgi:hypothetical protein